MISPDLSRRLGSAFATVICVTEEDLDLKDSMIEWLEEHEDGDLGTLEDLPDNIQELVQRAEASPTAITPSGEVPSE